jgi:hypothetical protein
MPGPSEEGQLSTGLVSADALAERDRLHDIIDRAAGELGGTDIPGLVRDLVAVGESSAVAHGVAVVSRGSSSRSATPSQSWPRPTPRTRD